MQLPKAVKLVEVGARDGLQNEKTVLSAEVKSELINRLSQTGLTHIEAGAFVSPKWVPQMANSTEVFAMIKRQAHICYSALVPNEQGLTAALAAKVSEVAVFTAASESFTQKNINCTIEQSVERFTPVVKQAKQHNLRVRGYVSCVLGCPYEGEIKPKAVLDIAEKLFNLGCDEISLGDTIGVGTPLKTQQLLDTVTQKIPLNKLAMHFHDTYGQALVNILASLEKGISIFDSSVSGLGGCPYAKGATGNVASEDVLYLLNGLGITTGVDLQALAAVGQFINQQLNRQTQSKVARALGFG